MILHAPMIRYFDAVRRAGSIREASRRLHVASSAVNRQILKLEDEVGAPLFDRMAKGMRLTAAGEIFARHAITVLQDAGRAEEELAALKGLRRGHVRIMAVEGLAVDLLPDALSRMRRDCPMVNLSIATAGSPEVAEAVIAGEADVGIAFQSPKLPDLRQVTVGHFRLGAVMPPHHPLAGRARLMLNACADFPWILACEPLSIKPQLAPALRRLGRPAPAVIEASSIELIKRLTLRGFGISFQTRLGLEEEVVSGRLVHIPLADGEIGPSELGVYVRAGRAVSTAAALLLEILIDAVAAHAQRDADA